MSPAKDDHEFPWYVFVEGDKIICRIDRDMYKELQQDSHALRVFRKEVFRRIGEVMYSNEGQRLDRQAALRIA